MYVCLFLSGKLEQIGICTMKLTHRTEMYNRNSIIETKCLVQTDPMQSVNSNSSSFKWVSAQKKNKFT